MKDARSTSKPLDVLIIEDSEDDAIMVVDYLESNGWQVNWQRVDNADSLKQAIEKDWQIILSDFTMPDFNGLEALKLVRQVDDDIPFVFVSGSMGENHAVEAIKCGAQDFIIKGQYQRLSSTIERELQDVDLRREQRHNRKKILQLSAAVEQTAESIMVVNVNGDIEYVNQAFYTLTGYAPSQVIGQNAVTLLGDELDNDYIRSLCQQLQQGHQITDTLRIKRNDGENVFEEKLISPIYNDKNAITHYVCTGRDITDRLKNEQSRHRLSAILEASPDLVAIFSPEGQFNYINAAGCRLLKWPLPNDVTQYLLADIFPVDIARHLNNKIIPHVTRHGAWRGESVILNQHKQTLPVSMVMLVHNNSSGQPDYYSLICRDISERKQFEQEIQYRNSHDPLTGLPNRHSLDSRCEFLIERARRFNRYMAVFSINLNNFSRVNDNLGHNIGDHLLQTLANKLPQILSPNDIVARQSGDEFTLIISDLNYQEDALTILKKIQKCIGAPLNVEQHEIYLTFSTGIALYPNDGNNITDLLRYADTAMHIAKVSGNNQYRFYEANMNARSHDILRMEADLRRAVEQQQFVLHFQPQIDIQQNKVVGMEALLRWQHPELGLVSPADFIPLLESSGLIINVGNWIIEQACLLHKELTELGHGHLRISVNVSAVQFAEPTFIEHVDHIIASHDIEEQILELEITENIAMRDPDVATAVLIALKQLGVRTAIDDFGTGYSSMSYLKTFPVDVLKIDRAFIKDLADNPSDAAIVEASIHLGKKMGLDIVAEGVETEQQLAFLLDVGCHIIQGFYYSRPLEKVALLEYLQENATPG